MTNLLRLILSSLLALALSVPALADTITVPAMVSNATIPVALNVDAQKHGPTGLLNNYILTVPPGWSYGCMSVLTNSAIELVVKSYISRDGSVTSFNATPIAGAFNPWQQVPLQGVSPTNAGATKGAYVVGAPDFLLTIGGASKVAVTFANPLASPASARVFFSLNNDGACGQVSRNISYFEDYTTVNAGATVSIPLIGTYYTSAPNYFDDMSSVTACDFYVSAIKNAGASTLNAYIEASPYNIANVLDDRVSFTQFAASGTFVATVAQYASAVPHALAYHTLAGGSSQAGLFTNGIVETFVAGAGGTWTVTTVGVCKR